MILIPAIDILEGKAVRLLQGDFDARTEYDADPLHAAQRWVQAGARALHVVDLDGARTGAPANLEQVARIAASVEIPVQLGGGIRTMDAVKNAMMARVARVVLGTAAFSDVDFLDQVVAEYGARVVVSVDAREGHLAASGWKVQTEIPVEAVVDGLAARGVRRFVFSSIERDGTMSGPDLDGALRVARAIRGTFIYSGGVSSLDDLVALCALRQVNMTGVIVGKALYEGRFTVREGQRALERA